MRERAFDGMIRFLGLDGPSDIGSGEQIPMWWGSSRAQRTRALVAWIIVGVFAYQGARWALPADDNLGGHAPMIFAALVFFAGSNFTERAMLRFPPES